MLASMFSEYCAEPSTIEPCKIVFPDIPPTLSSNGPDALIVSLPCTRPDIFHEVDIMEDAAVAYGFNNLPDIFLQPSTTAQPLPIGGLTEVIRREWAMAGWIEALPFILIRPLSPQRLYTSNPT
ncbi:hypothetical protein BDR03DRAFT_1006710 [Suillus americanus]|nr:hypothetical protein BDR03DRAFT_1006710 [Suillus americanus]